MTGRTNVPWNSVKQSKGNGDFWVFGFLVNRGLPETYFAHVLFSLIFVILLPFFGEDPICIRNILKGLRMVHCWEHVCSIWFGKRRRYVILAWIHDFLFNSKSLLSPDFFNKYLLNTHCVPGTVLVARHQWTKQDLCFGWAYILLRVWIRHISLLPKSEHWVVGKLVKHRLNEVSGYFKF